MNIPSTTKIAGLIYTTEYKSPLLLDNQQCYGVHDSDKIKIYLDNTLQEHQALSQTYLHEVLHGIEACYGIKLPKESQEDIIDKFAIGLYQFLEDNAHKLYDIKEKQQ